MHISLNASYRRRLFSEITDPSVKYPSVNSSTMSRTCRTCTRSIMKALKSYNCLACGCHMHLEPPCTGLSNVAINGIKELGRTGMLLCNVCIENNERDTFIRNRTVNNLEEKINKNMSSKAETLETQIAQIVEK